MNAPPGQAGAGDGTLNVRVVRDVNGNGSYEAALEVGVAGIPVTVTAPNGTTAKGTTAANGTVAVNLGAVSGGKYRVEAEIPAAMSYLQPAPAGGNLSSLTEFVDVSGGKNVSLTMGVWNPADYCQANPTMVTACQRNIRSVANDAAARSLITFPATARGDKTDPKKLSTQGTTGTVFGLAYQRDTKRVFSSAMAKRLTPYGPAGAGGIYVTDSATGATKTFATVPSAGSTTHAMNSNHDGPFFDVVGKQSLGGLELSEDDTELYVVNLSDRKLYVYDATQATASAPKGSYAIPNPGCAAAGDWRPFGLGVRDGVVYVGGVCSGQSSNKQADLKAVVQTFKGGTFATVLTKALTFERGTAYTSHPGSNKWYPWMGSWAPRDGFITNAAADGVSNTTNPSPMLTDIDIEADGDLVLAFRDRWGDQTGTEASAPDGSTKPTKLFNGMSGGDLNRACKSGNGYVWEGGTGCKNNNSGGAVSGNEPTSVVEYYPGEYFRLNENRVSHSETSQGATALLLQNQRMPVVVMDPLRVNTGGIGWFDRTNGTMENYPNHSNGYEIGNNDSEGFGKSNGLADLEALCDLAPVQIGNRVWFDTDSDGVQEGGEPALPGVKVQLVPCAGGAALATKTTNAKGEYYFNAADGVKPNTCYTLKFDYSGVNTGSLPGKPPVSSLAWTAKEAGPSRSVDSDVDPAGTAKVELGKAGSVVNTVDAGVVGSPPNSVGDLVWADTNRNGVQDEGEPGVPGVKVTAQRPDGTPLGTPATTGPDGKYRITPLPDGPVKVCFDLSALAGQYAGYQLTKANAGDDGKDSDADPATKCSAPTTLGPDKREDLTLDAGLRPPNRLGDFVWNDTNKNGLQDPGEPGVPNVPVTVKDDKGTEVGKTTTDANGKYLFDKLPDGTFTVCFTAPGDLQFTKPAAGDAGMDSNADPGTGCSTPVTLNADKPEDLTVDAGLSPPVNRIGDLVWADTNKNGLQDEGEKGVPGVSVTLQKADGAEVSKTTTDGGGKYLFEGMPDGSYKVCFALSALPADYAGYTPTTANAGDDAKDSDADPATGCSAPVTVGPGARSNLTVDAGIVSPPNKLGDLVWNDTNKNGLQDPGEPGIPGVTVTVKDDKGTEVGKTTTDANGKYLFDKLPDGTFTVCFAAPGDLQVTKPNAGDAAKDSNIDPATGCSPAVPLGAGKREDLTVDAGFAPPVNRVGDLVWLDRNKNGLQDDGEPGVPGVPVSVQKEDGTEVGKATTGPDGKYLVEGVPDGSYKVCFALKSLTGDYAGYQATKANAGDEAKDSDADPATGCTTPVTVGPGARENLTVDAGIVSPPNKLGDLVWNDTNRNGLQDPGEPGVPNVPVTVKDDKGTEVGKTTTGPDGKYVVDNLPDGTFTVCFAVTGDLQFTKPNAGDAGMNSDADPATGCSTPVTLGPGKRENLTVDAGLVPPVNRIGDLVWSDTNKNGLQDDGEPGVPGIVVTLQKPDGTAVGRDVTGSDGKYLFEGMPDGSYKVCFDLKALPADYAGSTATTPNAGDDGRDSDADPVTGCTTPITVGPGARENLTVDAGIVSPPNKLGDLVWNDTNRNGVQDPGEPGVPGVTVTVKDDKGTEVGKTTTGPDGKYLFDKLPDGTFTVCFAATGDLQLTKANAGDAGKDSDADPATGCTEPVTLGPGKREDLTVDAGFAPPVNRIGDLVWIDTNKDGLQNDEEPGVAGVSVSLQKEDGTEVAKTTTDKNGKYLFEGMPDGSYKVCFTATAGLAFTKSKAGAAGTDSDADSATGCTTPVTVGPGKRQDLTLDAGLVTPPNKLGDLVWNDTNRNGVQDPGEPGVPNVTVVVKDDKGTEVGKTTTGPDGKYSFDKLPDGTFTVCFTATGDLQFTKPTAGDAATDSDADPATGCSKPVKLGGDKREDLTVDAGLAPPVNRIGDLVWNDTNKNGLQDDGEPGVPGVTVTVKDDKGAEVAKTTTGPDGKYLVEGVPDGSYTVCFGTSADMVLTKSKAGDTAKDSDADSATGCSAPVTVGPGKRENLTVDAGLVAPPNKIGDFVWVDTNRNGVQDPGEPGVPDVPVVLRDPNGKEVTVKTGPDGKYVFTDVPDGEYEVCVDLKSLPTKYSGYMLTKPSTGDEAKDSDADPATGCAPVTVGPGKRENLNIDIGIVEPGNRIGDTVWVDRNRNGVQDSGEPGAPDVPVALKDAGGKEIAKVTTDADGKYLFDGVRDGSYTVCFAAGTLPAALTGHKFTKPWVGDPATDSDADQSTGCSKPVAVGPANREVLTVDAGLTPPPGTSPSGSGSTPVKTGKLADTGVDTGWLLVLGLLSLAGGGLLLLFARRCRRES
ncbi:carboxypeptidase regulatory-like domain-containing protein [Allokutzneria sp. A3M-2-11 16]|uniref:SdrD B-like domain-containing protein n=1 Tax=Allokutzneria sp. A3M-2-11 16 TaxID=2962043 RepID=UPI0020B64B55|nr:SdrD B-like domain-containing protein [Allokutzneria sp. A3M-2-11 16]MCP3805227.1 carboxypeptidase regulatory-like domain-containing protein [Allokutzneria sp. A3M-2-11 16]